MANHELSVSVKAEVEGIGDAETHTVDLEVAESVSELIKQNLRNRYNHLDTDTEINILALEPPNRVLIHTNDE